MSYVPLPLVAYCAYCFGYNAFVLHKVFKSLFWGGALAGSFLLQNNLKSNARTII